MKQVLIIADHPEVLHPAGDSSLALAEAALDQNWVVHWTEPKEIGLVHDEVYAQEIIELIGFNERLPTWGESSQSLGCPLRDYDLILIRKDPPFDAAYTSLCWLLCLEPGLNAVNLPAKLLQYHEKILHFAALRAGALHSDEVIPALVTSQPTLVSKTLRQWQNELDPEGYIIKPWLGYGGRGIRFAASPQDAYEVWLESGMSERLIVQPFDPNVRKTGDIRVLTAGRKVIGAFARIPALGKIESNLSQGGRAEPVQLSSRQLDILNRLVRFLSEQGIVFSGLDMIGHRINEINITSPTGLRALQAFGDTQAHQRCFQALLQAVEAKDTRQK